MIRSVWLYSLAAAFLALGLSACAPAPTPIAFRNQDAVRYTRCTFRPNQQFIYSSNYLVFPPAVRAGSPARVDLFTTQRVELTLNKIPYEMLPLTAPFDANPELYLKKYFVDQKSELGLESLEESTRKNIENGAWVIGMTKSQVYSALGPPNWVDFGVDATNLALEAILERNRWEYRQGDILFPIFPEKKVFIFDEGKLSQTIP